MARPIWSVALPAAKGTMKVMGLAGKDWAEAASGRAAASSKASRFRRGVRIVCLLCVFL